MIWAVTSWNRTFGQGANTASEPLGMESVMEMRRTVSWSLHPHMGLPKNPASLGHAGQGLRGLLSWHPWRKFGPSPQETSWNQRCSLSRPRVRSWFCIGGPGPPGRYSLSDLGRPLETGMPPRNTSFSLVVEASMPLTTLLLHMKGLVITTFILKACKWHAKLALERIHF